jgi:hypothetical protein
VNQQDRVQEADLPGLYQAAGSASQSAQSMYYSSLRWYLITLVLAAVVSFEWPTAAAGAILSASLFLVSLGVLILLRVRRPDDTWYNGRAVAESVKTRAWRWMMRADPYEDVDNLEITRKMFITDLKAILDQNRNLASDLCTAEIPNEAITPKMVAVRLLPVAERLAVYRRDRVDDQAVWYAKKSIFNKKRAGRWFKVSVAVHASAIVMLMLRIKDSTLQLPVEVVATLASSVLTWLKAKKHNELSSSYSLAAHEIVLIKGEGASINTESQLAEYVINAETAFSREHTQWAARKTGD